MHLTLDFWEKLIFLGVVLVLWTSSFFCLGVILNDSRTTKIRQGTNAKDTNPDMLTIRKKTLSTINTKNVSMLWIGIEHLSSDIISINSIIPIIPYFGEIVRKATNVIEILVRKIYSSLTNKPRQLISVHVVMVIWVSDSCLFEVIIVQVQNSSDASKVWY